MSRNHWITVSSISCETAHVDIYDSLPSVVSSRIKNAIAAICCTEEKTITMNIKNVQTQNGGSDCGLFALAFATSLCFGENPSDITYIQHEMRSHLRQCFDERSISLFPKEPKKKQYKAPSIITKHVFSIYCYCRQPESGRMIQCDICEQWFHKVCANAPSAVWKKRSVAWNCRNCHIIQ